ncbi:hypothetical protein FKW77_006188 [Venturia effusa]|uniref:Uncharacterized protein n=1 Tax=Venturia effusa TaxID=50376 RepID=A0A517KZK7_9PEZI|nr:hypothetical protein FKW77_006188 [Venturia effusa]
MNPTAIPSTPHKDLPPNFAFSTPTQHLPLPNHSAKHYLPANQKVLIRISSPTRTRIIYEDYPLTPLLTYSLRARRDLAHQAKTTWEGATLQWIVPLKNNTELVLSGFRMVLDFWRTLPPNGFAPDFLTKPGAQRVSISEEWIRRLGGLELLYLCDAFLELEPAWPLDDRRPRNLVLEMLRKAGGGLDCFFLGTLWGLFGDVDQVMVERACARFVDGFGLGMLRDESVFDCFDFTPGLRRRLEGIRGEKLELVELGVLPACSPLKTSAGSSGGGGSGEPKRKTRGRKKKSRKTRVPSEVSDDVESLVSTVLTTPTIATPRSSPPSSPASFPESQSPTSDIICELSAAKVIASPAPSNPSSSIQVSREH